MRLARTVCCGALDIHDGNLPRGLEFARRNVRALKRSGAEAIISAASGCAAVIASYGELLKDDPELANDARAVSARGNDLSALLLARGKPPGRLECAVTYHDSCHLVHGMGVREGPRKLLGSIAGVRLIEMAESDLCCGSAGSYNLLEPAMAHQLAPRKAEHYRRPAPTTSCSEPRLRISDRGRATPARLTHPRDPSRGFSRAGRKFRRVNPHRRTPRTA